MRTGIDQGKIYVIPTPVDLEKFGLYENILQQMTMAVINSKFVQHPVLYQFRQCIVKIFIHRRKLEKFLNI